MNNSSSDGSNNSRSGEAIPNWYTQHYTPIPKEQFLDAMRKAAVRTKWNPVDVVENPTFDDYQKSAADLDIDPNEDADQPAIVEAK